MKIFENLFELSKGALPVCLVPSKKPTTKFLTLNSCWKVYVTFQYFAHFLFNLSTPGKTTLKKIQCLKHKKFGPTTGEMRNKSMF